MTFKQEALNRHNEHRKKHGAVNLKYSSKLESSAQNWANQLAKKGYMQHEQQTEQGENIAVMKGTELTGVKATDMWYEEVKYYNYNNHGFNSKTGHFTQVVWAGSQNFGIGKAVSSNGMQFVVARYQPPGNMLRRFPDNVKPPGSKATSTTGGSDKPVSPRKTKKTSPKRTVATSDGRESDKTFRNSVMRYQNTYRKRHGAPALKWSTTLEQSAQEAANEAARTNTLRSVDLPNVGQNMAAMTGGELTGDKVATMWYDEEKNFNYSNPGFSSSTGSFTQLVWKETKEVGVGRAFGNQGQTFVVALYKPPGNVRGQYEENIGIPTGPVPTVTDKSGNGCNSCTIL